MTNHYRHDRHHHDPDPAHRDHTTAQGSDPTGAPAAPDADQRPRLTVADIVGGRDQCNDVIVFTERHGVALRYRLHIDLHLPQSHFLVEAFDPARRQWNVLWAIPQATYTFDGPHGRRIAAPDDRDPHHKAASWQQIIDTLTSYADRILAPHTPA
ncbi:hypothetical protein [Nocardia wallacei]|uniref:hypothetical protein n=1 Tax=Nocardia wallacei TaxID=480035 RepID=UPI002454BEC1|nr:hypothetical protein [Nocardia wallacei]